MDRRRLLAAAGSTLAAALAGCTGSGDGGATETTAAPTTDASTGGQQTTEQATTAAETTATETTATETAAPTTAGTTSDGAGEATVVTVAPGSELVFDPDRVTVAAGTAVRWEWAAGGHNVRPDSQPEGADWTGTAGGNGETYGDGHVYEHTFDVAGTYEYYCAPHRSIGMTGVVVVE